MASIQEIYNQASLSFAAYADMTSGMSQSALRAVLENQAKMSSSQATDFASKWTVIDQYKDTSGAVATVFQEIATGKKYLAIRGTEGIGDINADYILALGFPSYLNPQFIQLRNAVQTWVDNGTLSGDFTIAGHSLGGYLATALGTWFRGQTTDLYTYNAPGVGGLIGNVLDAFRAVFGLSNTTLVSGITNIRGTAGISAITGLGVQLTPPLMVETEFNANFLGNHSIVNVADSLALYATFAQLDSSVTTNQLTNFFKTANNHDNLTQESVLDSLRETLLGKSGVDAAPTVEGDRESFYKNLLALQSNVYFQTLKDRVTITNAPADGLTARSDFGARSAWCTSLHSP